MTSEEKIVLRSVSKPSSTDLKELTFWFIRVFDLGGKDDELEPALFKEIMANNIEGKGVTSKMLNKKLDVPRSTVIYHLNRFIYSGLVVRKGTKYYLRSEDMHGTIEELHADIEREFGRMMQFADMMDKLFEESNYAEENQNDDHADEDDAQAEGTKSDGEKQQAELKDRLLRMAAEFDNYKKRVAKDIDNSKEIGRAEVISKLLPTVDEFELALESLGKKDEHTNGITLIYSNLMSTLRSFGLREVDAEGKFDPYKHEIMLVQESEKADDTIIKVVRKGYMLNTIMLRPASVIVAKTTKPQEGENKKGE